MTTDSEYCELPADSVFDVIVIGCRPVRPRHRLARLAQRQQGKRRGNIGDVHPRAAGEVGDDQSPRVLVSDDSSHTYCVEYRQPITQDAFLSSYPVATNSVHVKVSAAFGNDTGPFALDFTPDSDVRTGYYAGSAAPAQQGCRPSATGTDRGNSLRRWAPFALFQAGEW